MPGIRTLELVAGLFGAGGAGMPGACSHRRTGRGRRFGVSMGVHPREAQGRVAESAAAFPQAGPELREGGLVRISDSEKEQFFREVDGASRRAVWCGLATVEDGAPRLRLVHPTWERDVLWLATDPASPKARQIRADPRVAIQYQVSPPDFVHICVRGAAEIVDDPATRERVWNLLDYDLSEFWPGGPGDPTYAPVRIVPARVELSEMFGTRNVRVWKRKR